MPQIHSTARSKPHVKSALANTSVTADMNHRTMVRLGMYAAQRAAALVAHGGAAALVPNSAAAPLFVASSGIPLFPATEAAPLDAHGGVV